ncbi:MAG: cell division protein ZapA [Bacteriovoracaceae bacterium]|jgi:cell division protein ZapA (FtsZ GTPase activity inhibitor)|nr:cell division protein ZapA [Bacteriovoracaceae bacterium]
MNQTEYDILGCTIRVKSDEDNKKALATIKLLNDEILRVKQGNSSLKQTDIAVLSALNIASRYIDVDAEFKESMFSFKEDVQEALRYVEQVSTGTVQPNA